MDGDRRQQIQTWMVQFADGERAAFQPLFDALWPVLLAFTARTLHEKADAEDAAQQAIIRVFSRIADFDRNRDGVAWALAIAGYEVMTLRRQVSRRREVGSIHIDEIEQGGRDVESQTILGDLGRAVREILGDLPERDREALAYAFTGESSATDERSRKRRFRAIERLRAAWRRAHG